MGSIPLWFSRNLDILYFFNANLFLSMGMLIWVLPKKDHEDKIIKTLWLLGFFGILHGLNDFFNMWSLIKGRSVATDIARWATLTLSFTVIFEFGGRLFYSSSTKYPGIQARFGTQKLWPLILFIDFAVMLLGFFSSDFWLAGTAWARYLLAFPAGIISAFAFFRYFSFERKKLASMKIRNYFILAGSTFFFFAAVEGLIVPGGNFFPASLWHAKRFFLIMRVPVELFHMLVPVMVLWSISGIVKSLNRGDIQKLKTAHAEAVQQLAESQEQYSDIVENAPVMIQSVDRTGHIIFANRRVSQVLGYSREELIGKSIRDVYAPESWDDTGEGFKKLISEGRLRIASGKLMKKNGERVDVEIESIAIYGKTGEFERTRSFITEISKLN